MKSFRNQISQFFVRFEALLIKYMALAKKSEVWYLHKQYALNRMLKKFLRIVLIVKEAQFSAS